jgi:hypothetical protein
LQDLGANPQLLSVAASPFAQMGLQYGKNVFNNSRVSSLLSLEPLKYYFNVNNSYVINKVRVLLFPWAHKTWKRQMIRRDEAEFFCPPRDDLNAPDLYIPLMAFVTYVVLIGFVMGTNKKFTPEVLGTYASTGLVTTLLEVLFIKAGFYFFDNIAHVDFLDVLAYCGYLFVQLVLNVIVGLFFGPLVYHVILCITSLSMALFLVRTLRLVIPQGQHLRNPFLLTIAGFQFILAYFLGMAA